MKNESVARVTDGRESDEWHPEIGARDTAAPVAQRAADSPGQGFGGVTGRAAPA